MIRRLLQSAGRRIRSFLRLPQRQVLPAAEAPSSLAPETSAEVPSEPTATEARSADVSSSRRKRKPRKDWQERFQVEPEDGKSRFHDFDLPDPVMHAIFDLGFRFCTPVQAEALPAVLAGSDMIGKANTGTGKSAVFLIAVFSRLLGEGKAVGEGGRPRALIIAPTRELVVQIAKDGRDLAKYTQLRIVPVFGGTDYRGQMDDLRDKRCDVVVATPGRLLDYLGKNVLTLDDCRILVIDEADRMLDMGFIPDVRRIVHRLPDRSGRQTLLFSATVNDDVRRLASQWCKDPVNVEIEPEQVAVQTVEQIVYLVTSDEKYDVLYNLAVKNPGERMLVFVNQKNEARRLSERMRRNGINCNLLTGDVAQQQRSRRLEDFRAGRIQVLVATDVAGRGIHIEGINYVVNYNLPYEPEDYVHRIGRTGRAGAAGVSISFACEEGSFSLPLIEEFIGRKLDCVVPDEALLVPAPKGTAATEIGGGKQETTDNKNESGRRRRRPRSGSRPAKTGKS